MDKVNCSGCIYCAEFEGSVTTIECKYPLPASITNGRVFTSKYQGFNCPVRKTPQGVYEGQTNG